MHPLNRAQFRQVVTCAQKNKKQLREFLSHTKYLDYAQITALALAIEKDLLRIDSTLDPAETRRFSEIICGVADRINAEAIIDAREMIPEEAKMFRNTKRSVVLDERYDIQNKLTNTFKDILTEWLDCGCDLEENKQLEKKISAFHAFAAGAKHCDPLVQKDIEAHIMQKTIVLEDSTMSDRHLQELRELAGK